jgi:hypothetical protein
MTLREQIAEANRKAGLDRQRVVGKKMSIRQSDGQIIDMLCSRITDLEEAFYKNGGTDAVREAIRNLASARRIAEKRARS